MNASKGMPFRFTKPKSPKMPRRANHNTPADRAAIDEAMRRDKSRLKRKALKRAMKKVTGA